MPRRAQPEINQATSQQIKDTARQLMQAKGTAGLSLRAIARNLGMTAPALYHYFDSLDSLITALILDAFTNYASYVREMRNIQSDEGYFAQVWAAVSAYRDWALHNPNDFQLIYGNPIPGYEAPSEVTTPAARSLGQVFFEPIAAAFHAGELSLMPAYQEVPPAILSHYQTKYAMDMISAQLFHSINHIWAVLHGIVVLEVYNHLLPVVGDPTAFYEQAARSQMQQIYIWHSSP